MKKIGLLCLAVVLALGALGVGYAAWTDTITIEGDVTTGSLCWEFVQCRLLDDYEPIDPGGDYPTPTPDYTCSPGFEGGTFWALDKNVGWGGQNISADGKTLYVTLNNVYPCYFNELGWYVHNCGTVPLKVDHILINGTTKLTASGYVPIDFNGDGKDDFEIRYGDNFGAQIEPGENSMLEFSLWMHVLQPCPQGMLDELTFTIEIVAVQWNEYPLP